MTTTRMLTGISYNNATITKLGSWMFWLALFAVTLTMGPQAHAAINCEKTINADVVVFDSPTIFNRLGAQNPNWIQYALRRDAIYMNRGNPLDMDNGKPLTLVSKDPSELVGNVELRPDKRPRPLVLRSVAGACLNVKFQNLLDPQPNPNKPILAQQNNVDCAADPTNAFCALDNNDQVAGRCAGIHAQGAEVRSVMADDGSLVGNNHPGADIGVGSACAPGTLVTGEAAPIGGLVPPGGTIEYQLYTPKEGAFILNNYGSQLGSEASLGNTALGMFGALNVEPKGARIYRSQVTEEEMRLATRKNPDGSLMLNPGNCTGTSGPGNWHGVDCDKGGQPLIDYEATYPFGGVWAAEDKEGRPVLNMLQGEGCDKADWSNCDLVHSDINAIIAGPDPDGTWTNACKGGSKDNPMPDCPYPLESVGKNNPQLPNRIQAFREFTSLFHDEQTNSQVFPKWYNDPVLGFTLAGVKDQFMINYGSGGIGSEIIANRLRTGPMHDCTDCAYEEFFLSATTVGDPALLVNTPANSGIEQCDPSNFGPGGNCWRDPVNLANGPIPDNYALYQEDPSNVHHSYVGDFTKVRNTHAGSFEQHIFHLHNHQWLFNPNDDNANYLDAQEIMPGSGHTYELVNGGVGNRNHTVGDAIFHCHFYPHFAQGMWYHIRIMDVFEKGSLLAVSTPEGALSGDSDEDGDGFHDNRWALRSGQPAPDARAHADGELPDGVPIPAIVPLPGRAMAPMPAEVSVMAVDRGNFSLLGGRTPPDPMNPTPDSSQAVVDWDSVKGADGTLGTPDDVTPGYPFWIAGYECGPGADKTTGKCPQGVVGQRFPTPPLDMLTAAGAGALASDDPDSLWHQVDAAQAGGWNGGLPRHALLGYTAGGYSKDVQNRLDFQKVIKIARPVYYPETGTELEKVSMRWQSVRYRDSLANRLDNTATYASFVMNGAKPVPGGPYNDPCIDDLGTPLDGQDGLWFDGDGSATSFNTKGSSEYTSKNPRTYKVANIQIDAVFNKVGYHYPQERIISLWEDVDAHVKKQRPPEPLVMRFNTFDCGKLLHSNLVPHEYEIDDFQVRTPTDIIGQHIHLPKWDLTTNDGAANGWNYEDGALAPGMVTERIHAINEFNKWAGQTTTVGQLQGGALATSPLANVVIDLSDVEQVATIESGDIGDPVEAGVTHLEPLPHPFFGSGACAPDAADPNPQCGEYIGARTVIQRILVDPVVNVAGVDRGLGLTFSHDHYGPSTFQQIGLYSTILAEPAGSKWVHNETGEELGIRHDGGPTTWQAAILPPATPYRGSTVRSEDIPDHREFYFEMSDFQHAYEPGAYFGADEHGVPMHHEVTQPYPFDATTAYADDLRNSWQQAVNPPLKLKSVPFPDVVTAGHLCPGPVADANGNPDRRQATNASPFVPRPCVEAINISHSSMWVVNYRNEPVGLRVFDPDKIGPDGQNGAQADADKGDLALAFQSRTDRVLPQLNTSLGDTPYPAASHCSGNGDGINCDRRPGDPFTPIMRAYEYDQVKIKVQVGATEEQHQTSFHGLKWLSNGSGFGRSPNSGWRNFQSHGISEQFSLQMPVIPDRNQMGSTVDYLYAQDATRDGIWGGTWGLIRSYKNKQQDLFELPENSLTGGDIKLVDENNFSGVCPKYQMDENGNILKDGKGKNARPREVPLVRFDVAAVLVNKVLDNALGEPLGLEIPSHDADDPQFPGTTFGQQTVGASPNPDGGTLIYNRRGTGIMTCDNGNFDEAGNCTGTERQVAGPLNDPTAMMYVRLEDLEPRWIEGVSPDTMYGGDGIDDRCQKYKDDGTWNMRYMDPECPMQLRADAPVEPLVLRANAGDCIEVTVHNKFLDQAVADPTKIASSDPSIWYNDNGVMKSLFEKVEYDKLKLQGKSFETRDGVPITADDQVMFDGIPDLAGWQDVFWVVNRDMFKGDGTIKPLAQRRVDNAGNPEMHYFNNNLIAPSKQAGMHAQLVEYDASRDDGVVAGQNQQSTVAGPRAQHTYRYYAGHIDTIFLGVGGKGKNTAREFKRRATPIEFGGTNLLSADRVKQPQKGLYGALIIEPQDACHADSAPTETCTPPALERVADGQGFGSATRETRTQATIKAPVGGAGSGGTYDEAVSVGFRIANLRWADGTAVSNIHQDELGREGAEDSGHAGFNYGTEPSWYRFGLAPDTPFGRAGAANTMGSIPNVHAYFANGLVSAEPNHVPYIHGIAEKGDPATPVFRAAAGQPSRMYLLNGASADRDATFVLHGHIWQRDPFVCPNESWLGLPGMCDYYRRDGEGNPVGLSIGSLALGLNPIGKYMGGEEGMGHVYGHWPILFNAGGTAGTPGDYLYRDYAPSGSRNGMFGILRAEPSQ